VQLVKARVEAIAAEQRIFGNILISEASFKPASFFGRTVAVSIGV
jgi:hypothetical protein